MKTKYEVEVNEKLLYSPLDIPEKKIGKYEIKHDVLKRGAEVTVVSLRNSLFYGIPSCKVNLPRERIIHKLCKQGHGILMTDSPQETFMMSQAVEKAHGDILVGGLGLGYYPSVIAKDMINGKNKKVKSITVVEIDEKVIKLVAPYLPKNIKVVHADLFKYLASGKAKFDFAYIDIWYPTGQMEWSEYIVPLRRLIHKKYGFKDVECWAETEMQGQIRMSVLNRPQMEKLMGRSDTDYKYDPTLNAFYKARKTIISFPETKSEDIDTAVLNIFLYHVGTEKWEKLFKWDEALKEQKEFRKENNY